MQKKNAPYSYKKGFVWIFADWCTESEEMMNTHLQNPDIIEYINKYFYPILFNGEQKEDIQVKGKTWRYKQMGEDGCNELLLALTDMDPSNLNKKIAYPKIVFLDENMNKIVPINGKLSFRELESILSFVATDSFKKMNVEQFMLNYEYRFTE